VLDRAQGSSMCSIVLNCFSIIVTPKKNNKKIGTDNHTFGNALNVSLGVDKIDSAIHRYSSEPTA